MTKKHNPSPAFKQEVEALLENSTVAEAQEEVWKRFYRAMSRLRPEDSRILETYFQGQKVETLAAAMQLTVAETKALITKAKRDLLNQMRGETKMRQ